MAQGIAAAGETLTVSDLPIRALDLPYAGGAAVAKLGDSGACAIYVCSGLNDHIPAITQVTRRKKILSFSGDEDGLRKGLSVGLLFRNGKHPLLIERENAKSEGADLDSALFHVAEAVSY
jgi:hypothetical protein